MTAVFIATSLAPRGWPVASYVRAFAEAAMVGACADWFAVTALFSRPLGLPIPHTAIIPRNKDRIGQALGRFIVDNFLSLRVLDAKLRQLEITAWGADWLARPQNARLVARRIVAWTPQILRALPEGLLEELAGSVGLAAACALPAAPTAAKLLSALWSDSRAQSLVTSAARSLGAYLTEHQELILEGVQAQSWKWLPKWVDETIAQKITEALVQFLSDAADPAHPWRQTLTKQVEGLVARLETDVELRAKAEMLKQELLADLRWRAQARELWREMGGRLGGDWAENATAVEDKITQLLGDMGAWLRDEPSVQRMLNTGARALVRSVVAPRRQEIGQFVARIVAAWDAKDLVERLELQMGAELQYIRVNGTLVGGLVGLGLYALSQRMGWR